MKQTINKEHPRIKNRTPEMQEYRDNLAKILREKRNSGDKEGAYNSSSLHIASRSKILIKTSILPSVDFYSDGKLFLKGLMHEGIHYNHEYLFRIMFWLSKYVENPAPETILTIDFEELHGSSKQELVRIIKILKPIYESLVINFYYEEDDEDILDGYEFILDSLGYGSNKIKKINIIEKPLEE